MCFSKTVRNGKQTAAGGWRVYDYKKNRLCIRAQGQNAFSIRWKYLALLCGPPCSLPPPLLAIIYTLELTFSVIYQELAMATALEAFSHKSQQFVFLVCTGGCELVEIQVPLVVGGSPSMTYPRFEVWGAWLEKVCSGLRHKLLLIVA